MKSKIYLFFKLWFCILGIIYLPIAIKDAILEGDWFPIIAGVLVYLLLNIKTLITNR